MTENWGGSPSDDGRPSQSGGRYRIVSLVPSLTETLCDLGLRNAIVGCTNFCIEPAGLRQTVPAVGGTKDPNFDLIDSLKPTHVVVNDEENTQAFRDKMHAASAERGWQVVDTFPVAVRDVIPMLTAFGRIFGVEAAAAQWVERLEAALGKGPAHGATRAAPANAAEPLRACYFIWRDPWMVAGDRTFIAAMLATAGIELTVRTGDGPLERYPVIEPADPRVAAAQALLFSSEPFPFRNRQIEEFEELSGKRGASFKVDGQLLSWFGTRSVAGVQYASTLRSEIERRLRGESP